MEYPKIFFTSANLPVIELTGPIGVVCHDVGGANQVSAMCLSQFLRPAVGYFEGPAEVVFSNHKNEIQKATNLGDLIDSVAILITGTGWSSNLEHKARLEAKKKGIPSISILDHWVNYKERFERNGTTILPDEIWVVDDYAVGIAEGVFQKNIIKRVPDYYTIQQVDKIKSFSSGYSDGLLYLLEPIRSDWGRGISGEFQALQFLINMLPELGIPAGTNIRLRLHPSEPIGKYDTFLGQDYGYPVTLESKSLASAIANARWIAGCNTFALTLALAVNKTVICSLPPWATPCVLPHSGIHQFRNKTEVVK